MIIDEVLKTAHWIKRAETYREFATKKMVRNPDTGNMVELINAPFRIQKPYLQNFRKKMLKDKIKGHESLKKRLQERWPDFDNGEKKLRDGGVDEFGNKFFEMNVSDDHFIHFTTLSRAKQIMESGKLLQNPPHDRFGIDATSAVSLNYGGNIPGVQTTHSKEPLVGIVFKTNTKPDYGHVEETVWHEDVELMDPKVIRASDGVELLNNTKEDITFDDGDDSYMVKYV